VRAYDKAGNEATSETRTIRVENTPPDTVVTSSPDELTRETRASFEFESPDEPNASFGCISFDGSAFEPCDSPKEYNNLSDGEHTFRVRGVDEAGNVDPSAAQRIFTVDSTASNAPEILSPANGSTDNDGNFTVSRSAEPGSTIGLYQGETLVGRATTDESGNWSVDLRDVSEVSHTYHATATDRAGNTSGPSQALVVTVKRPVVETPVDTIITRGPPGPSGPVPQSSASRPPRRARPSSAASMVVRSSRARP
jgi:large repetitive protein